VLPCRRNSTYTNQGCHSTSNEVLLKFVEKGT
jgi:hypothetical protein